MRGMIIGGWEYIRAAYIITAVILSTYALSVVWRYRSEINRQNGEEAGDERL